MLEVLFGVLFGPKKVLFCMKTVRKRYYFELNWYYKVGKTGMDLFHLIQGSYAMESLQEPLGISVKVQDVANEVEQTVNALEGEGHALQTIARSSTAEAGLPPQLC